MGEGPGVVGSACLSLSLPLLLEQPGVSKGEAGVPISRNTTIELVKQCCPHHHVQRKAIVVTGVHSVCVPLVEGWCCCSVLRRITPHGTHFQLHQGVDASQCRTTILCIHVPYVGLGT